MRLYAGVGDAEADPSRTRPWPRGVESRGDSARPGLERVAERRISQPPEAAWRPTLLQVGGRWAQQLRLRAERRVSDAAVRTSATPMEAAGEGLESDAEQEARPARNSPSPPRAASAGGGGQHPVAAAAPADEAQRGRTRDQAEGGDNERCEGGLIRLPPLVGWRLPTWNLQKLGGPDRLEPVMEAVDVEDPGWCCMSFQEGGRVGASTGDSEPHDMVDMPGFHMLVAYDGRAQMGIVVNYPYKD